MSSDSPKRHTERCPKCKENIKVLLKELYSEVEVGYKFDVGLKPEDFRDTPYYFDLLHIYDELKDYRGYGEFVRSKTLSGCDFYVPSKKLIIEFDESQHFTQPRKIALDNYPNELKISFDKKRWSSLCASLDKRDNDPLYRDEQRAWYDTIRDFLPAIKCLEPIVRLYSNDYKWCDLNPKDANDLNKFESLLYLQKDVGDIEIKYGPDPLVARVVIDGKWDGIPDKAKKVLQTISNRWPENKHVKFMITCGGFVNFEWPNEITREVVTDNRNPPQWVLNELIDTANNTVDAVIPDYIRVKLSEHTDFISLGVDSFKAKISTTENYIGELHVELVCVINLKNGKRFWTGKSYPTPQQAKGLLWFPVKNHIMPIDGIGNIAVLGCHDLTIYNPRSKPSEVYRNSVKEEFKKEIREANPVFILQHPHTTDSILTWINAWHGLERELPSTIYASAGSYYNENFERSDITDVLEKTKNSASIDFVVNVRK